MSLSFHGICLIYIWSLAIWKTEGKHGANGLEVIWCNSLNTLGWNIASLPPCPCDNGSPGLTPGPDGDSVTGIPTLAILPHSTHWLDSAALPSSKYSYIAKWRVWPNCADMMLKLWFLCSTAHSKSFLCILSYEKSNLYTLVCMFWSNLALFLVSKLAILEKGL